MPSYLVLVPRDGEWHAATREGLAVTTTERTQIALRSMEGRRPPTIVVSTDMPTIDLVDLLTGTVEPTSRPATEPSTDGGEQP